MTVRLYTDAGLKNGVGSWAFVIVVPDVDLGDRRHRVFDALIRRAGL